MLTRSRRRMFRRRFGLGKWSDMYRVDSRSNFCCIALEVLVGVTFLLVGLSSGLSAQSRTTSAIRGVALTVDGSPLSGASVMVRHVQNGATRSTITNQQGGFLVLLLAPGGPYEVTVRSLGYAEFKQEGIVLQVGDVTTINATMREQAVEVEGVSVEVDRDAVFNPARVGQATILSERIVESMPLLSRDISELALLSPLVKMTENGGFSVAGQNDRYNSLLIDGVMNKDMFGLTSGGVPGGQAGAKLIPLDAVTQYEVLITPFDVRLSGFTGGVMNAVTRSGTNDLRIRAAAVTRNEALMGDLQLPTGPVAASGVDRSLLALSVGGPIVRDRGHFYVAGEFEERGTLPPGFNLFRDDPALIRITPVRLTEATDIFRSQYGSEPGSGEVYSLGQTLANLFARVDWNFDGGSRLALRNIYSSTQNDESPNRAAFDQYELSSNTVSRSSTSNSTSLQVFSPITDEITNQLDLKFQVISDDTEPASRFPQIDVGLRSPIGESTFFRSVRFGGNYFGQENGLNQQSLSLTNALDIARGNDILTLGVGANYYNIQHRYLPGAGGSFSYQSTDSLLTNAPERFERTIVADGSDPTVDFRVLELGAFAQTQMNAGGGLSMRFGIRIDAPFVLDAPTTNFDLLDRYGYDTGRLPGGNFQISPRWGFNWQSEGEKRTQVRMGTGFFAGQLPYVWLSNAFHQDGARLVTQLCDGRIEVDNRKGVPPYVPGSPPSGCLGSPFDESASAVVFRSDFKYPQDLKIALTVDRELTGRITGSLGAIFSKALNQVGLEELNIERGPGPFPGELGGSERRGYISKNRSFGQVLLVNNDGEDWAASFSAEFRGRLTEGLRFRASYALSRSWDRMSLQFADMQSNFGFNAVELGPNDTPLTNSVFDRPHKVVLTLFGTPFSGLPDTEISLLYIGQSGLPFTYVYGFDANGDGYPSSGAAFERYNDPVHVPADAGRLPSGIASQILFAKALKADDCLRKFSGQILDRNGCRAPWQSNLDLRVAHTVTLGAAVVRLESDLVNLLNLLNGDWGHQRTIRSVAPLLDRAISPSQVVQWGGASLPVRDSSGDVQLAEPWNTRSPASQWQAQFGVRITFGGAR